MDETTVKCFLSNEEMEEYDIDYKDFIMRNEKAREVVQDIVAHASEEVGFMPPKCAFDLQIMMVPNEGLILTFSEKDQVTRDSERLIECLKELKRLLKTANEATARKVLAEMEAGAAEIYDDDETEELKPIVAAFSFTSLRNAMSYAAALPSNLRIGSELYLMDGLYYLYLRKGGASYDRYTRACIQALEFGELYTAIEPKILLLQQNGVCLIPKKAIKRLASIVKKAQEEPKKPGRRSKQQEAVGEG